MSSCRFGTMEWYCVLQDGHDGPHRSGVLVDPTTLTDDEREAVGLPQRGHTVTMPVADRIRELHQPREQEAEFFFDRETGRSEHCFLSCTWETCAGHSATVKVCEECGYEDDGDNVCYRPWPCPTIRALDLLDNGARSGTVRDIPDLTFEGHQPEGDS